MNTVQHTAETLPKPGQRIECVSMLDDFAVPPGARGTVLKTYSMGEGSWNIEVAWDSGSGLSLVSDVDEWKVLSRE
jgi:Domain of unknown function (DUF4314)